MNRAIALILAIIGLMAVQTAAAKGTGNLDKPVLIRVKATDLFFHPVRNYECTLESTPTGSWFLDEKISLKISARSVQDAVELALTPYVVEAPTEQQARVVKIVVNGREMKVRDITCKELEKTL